MIYEKKLMDQKELYEEELNKYLSRREFLKKIAKKGPPAAFAAAALVSGLVSSSCKGDNTTGPITQFPANEARGRQIMKQVTDSVLPGKGYSGRYEIKEKQQISNDFGAGSYDIVVYIDTMNRGVHDFILGMNYITDEDSAPFDRFQDLKDSSRVKTKEIMQSRENPVTDDKYLTDNLTSWMDSAVNNAVYALFK